MGGIHLLRMTMGSRSSSWLGRPMACEMNDMSACEVQRIKFWASSEVFAGHLVDAGPTVQNAQGHKFILLDRGGAVPMINLKLADPQDAARFRAETLAQDLVRRCFLFTWKLSLSVGERGRRSVFCGLAPVHLQPRASRRMTWLLTTMQLRFNPASWQRCSLVFQGWRSLSCRDSDRPVFEWTVLLEVHKSSVNFLCPVTLVLFVVSTLLHLLCSEPHARRFWGNMNPRDSGWDDGHISETSWEPCFFTSFIDARHAFAGMGEPYLRKWREVPNQ